MLSRLIREFSSHVQWSGPGLAQKEVYNKNLQIISDSMNYTHSRISRVIRAYYFISVSHPDTNWQMNPAITSSLAKVQRLVRGLDSESTNTLIINLGWLRIYFHSIWDDLEIAFLTKSHIHLPLINIFKVCESFQMAQRKNSQIWNVIENLLMKNYSEKKYLSPKHISIVYKSFALVNKGSEQLFSNFNENIKLHINELTIASVVDLLNGMKTRNTTAPEILDQLLVRGLQEISKSNSNYYKNILRLSLLLNAADERISEIEKLYLKSLNLTNGFKLLKIVSVYLDENLNLTSNRRKFIEKVLEFYIENSKTLVPEDRRDKETLEIKTYIIYVPIKFGIQVPEAETKSLLSFLEAHQKSLDPQLVRYKDEIEKYSKEKFIV